MEDYKTRITQAKEDAVKALQNEFEGYTSFIFTDYRGLTVAQITDIRKALRQDDAAYRVVKNRYAKIALKNIDRSGAEEQMIGPTAVALAKGESVEHEVIIPTTIVDRDNYQDFLDPTSPY